MGPEVDRLVAYIHPSSTIEASLPILDQDIKLPHPSGHSNLGRFIFFLRRERDFGEGKVQMDD